MASPTVPLKSTHATGPRTAEGKARSSQNSRKHGLSAINLNVLPKEQAEFDTYQNELLDQIKPQSGLQADLFRQLVHAGWSLIRLERYEFEILQQGNPFDSPEAQAKLDRLERYRAAHRRAYARLLAEMRKLQTDASLWFVTHPAVQVTKDRSFPLANPASSNFNKRILELSDQLRLADSSRRAESRAMALQDHFDKTNSPEPASRFVASDPTNFRLTPLTSVVESPQLLRSDR
jgi:hypothetical protein